MKFQACVGQCICSISMQNMHSQSHNVTNFYIQLHLTPELNELCYEVVSILLSLRVECVLCYTGSTWCRGCAPPCTLDLLLLLFEKVRNVYSHSAPVHVPE